MIYGIIHGNPSILIGILSPGIPVDGLMRIPGTMGDLPQVLAMAHISIIQCCPVMMNALQVHHIATI